MLDDNSDFKVLNEAFPILGNNVRRLWGKAELIGYVEEILQDAQGNPLKHLPVAVTASLLGLLEQNKQAHPQLFPVFDEDPDFKVIGQAFPHIGVKIKDLWGRKEFVSYMESFLNDNRDNHRKGFPGDVLMALFNISELHRKSNPHLYSKATIWSYEEH